MIQFEIEKYKPSFQSRSYFPHFNHQQQHPNHTQDYGPFAPLGKLEFAQYISKLPVKQGDFIVSKNLPEQAKYTEWQVYYIVSVQEIHLLVNNWGTNRTGPSILEIVSWLPSGVGNLGATYYNGANLYRKIKEEQVPSLFLEAVNAKFRDPQVPTPTNTEESPEQQPET